MRREYPTSPWVEGADPPRMWPAEGSQPSTWAPVGCAGHGFPEGGVAINSAQVQWARGRGGGSPGAGARPGPGLECPAHTCWLSCRPSYSCSLRELLIVLRFNKPDSVPDHSVAPSHLGADDSAYRRSRFVTRQQITAAQRGSLSRMRRRARSCAAVYSAIRHDPAIRRAGQGAGHR